jgi:hypothetical protein
LFKHLTLLGSYANQKIFAPLLLASSIKGYDVAFQEFKPYVIKKSVVGYGHAEKNQAVTFSYNSGVNMFYNLTLHIKPGKRINIKFCHYN